MMQCITLLFTLFAISYGSLFPIDFSNQSQSLKSLFNNHEHNTKTLNGIKIESGYISVGKRGGKLFYLIVPSDQETGKLATDSNTPWIVWLQGGPGCSSDFAFVVENGPLRFTHDGELKKNPHSWHQLGDIIYVDQPVGTGFSEGLDYCNYATTENDIALDMEEFFEKLVYTHSELATRPLYITGESYGGHYVPSIAYHLVKYPVYGINLKGVAIGNGWVDPIKQYPAYATFAHENGMIGEVGYKLAEAALSHCVALLEQKSVLGIIQCNAATSAIIGKRNPYDIRLQCDVPPLCYNESYVTNFFNDPNVQSILGTHKKWVDCNNKVYTFLLGDFDTQTSSKVKNLLNARIKVLLYNGMEDFICNWMGTEKWISDMIWSGHSEFAKQSYQKWSVDGADAGEFKQVNNLAFMKIYGAGHMVPMDKPAAALEMMKQFLNGNTFHPKEDTVQVVYS